MKISAKAKLTTLAGALALAALLVAAASGQTNAYFIDVHAGTMSGTVGSGCGKAPYRLEPGTSRAQHWESGGCQQGSRQLVARYDSLHALCLDFGDVLQHSGTTWPDVFRLVSLVGGPRAVTFSVSGPIAPFVTDVRLRAASPASLQRGRPQACPLRSVPPTRRHLASTPAR